jgi:predicted membrane channel-forming protein YqfA (hemolysin III family)
MASAHSTRSLRSSSNESARGRYGTRFRITGHDASTVLKIPEKADPTEGTLETYGLLAWRKHKPREEMVNGLIYLVGLIVIIMFILSFFGLR